MLLGFTILSTLAAIVMGAVAWRATRDERLRSAARVAALAREIHTPGMAAAAAPEADFDLRPDATPAEARDLFAAAPVTSSGSHYGLALAIAGFVLVSAAAIAVVLSGASPGASAASSSANAPVPSAPLELVALGHERDGDRLTVRGVVRNPAA